MNDPSVLTVQDAVTETVVIAFVVVILLALLAIIVVEVARWRRGK